MIRTERLFLRRISQEDIDLIFEINNDPECIKFNSWNSMSLDKCKAVINNWMLNHKDTEKTGVFCVFSKADKDKVGMAYILDYKESKQFEIGFRLRSSYWNRGYAKEITRGFIRYAAEDLNAKVVIAEVYKANLRSRNVFEKLDFEMFVHPDGDDGLLYRYVIKKS